MLLLRQQLSNNHLQFVPESRAVRVVGDRAEKLGVHLRLSIHLLLRKSEILRSGLSAKQHQFLLGLVERLLRNPTPRRCVRIAEILVHVLRLRVDLGNCGLHDLVVLHIRWRRLVRLLDHTTLLLKVGILEEVVIIICLAVGQFISFLRHFLVFIVPVRIALLPKPPLRLPLKPRVHLVQLCRGFPSQVLRSHGLDQAPSYCSLAYRRLHQVHDFPL
mmetsp:Transcript_38735/g.95104  ORF Transcript_38735/g.95104 Transcript_38735/m.95104 type:complete len:217 (-) Transcript_38735:395-1045(-)